MATPLFEPGSPDVLYLVDLSSYMLRAYHAVAPLTGPTGEPTHAVHGTVTMLERLFRERKPALVAIAMDAGRTTFRKEIYEDYKANRPPAPEDLRVQIARCEQIVRAYGLSVFKQEGVEADDLIATAVKKARDEGLRVVVVGADKDLMQLVASDVVLWDTMRNRVFGPPEVKERFGVPPEKLGDLLALMGDSSDNIPGVPSVGPKTASQLLTSYESLDGIYAHVGEIKRKKLRETLEENEEQARLSRRLVALKDDCPLEVALESLRFGNKDYEALEALYTELGFQRQLAALRKELNSAGESASNEPSPGTESPSPAQETAGAPETVVVLDAAGLGEVLAEAKRTKILALEPHTTRPDAHRGPLLGLALSTAPGKAHYVPLGHRYVGAPSQLSLEALAAPLADVLAEESVRLVSTDSKRTRVILENAGIEVGRVFSHDAMLASYLIDPERNHALEATASEVGIALPDYDSVAKKGRRRLDWDELEVPEAAPLAGLRIDALLRAMPVQRDRLDSVGLSRLFDEVELPLARLLASMELRGVLVDTSRLATLGKQCTDELAVLQKQAHEIAGKEFNVNSPRQLETLLFDDLGLKPIKRTKTSRSTDAATLEALSEEHPLPDVILQIRQLAKLKGTYIDALPALVQEDTGRIHGAWEQAVAATGRLSSTDPNLQNIPIRTELGRKIREAFVAPPGHSIVSADYSQIELRVLAHLSGDDRLVEAFQENQDIHTRTAMEIFEVAEDGVTREMRTKAKAVNFGVIYGQGEGGLSKALKIPRQEAGRFIAAYFRRYDGVRRFMDETLERARAGEAVQSILGRRRLVADIKSGNRARRLAAERIAMNMPIQGSAADILKLAMLALSEPVTPGARMVLTVHDELVFEVPHAEVSEAEARIREKMEAVYPLAVPLVVDVGHGENWNAAH